MTAEVVEKFFTANRDVKFVRLQWVDYSGVLRTRIITKTRCVHLANGTDCYQLAQNCMVIPISTAPRCFPDGIEDWNLRPDWETLMVCGFAPVHASVMCFTAHLGLANPFARCPRKLLYEVLDAFQGQHESKLLMGFEIEFVLLDESSNLAKSFDRMIGYSMTAGLRTKNLVIMEEIVAALEMSGIEVYHFHAEIVDQLEIALSPLPPIQAIDALMMAQETIRTICIRHGLRATTTPKPVFNGPQNGCHVHLSLNPAPEATFFLAGVLQKLKALCAFGLPNYDSYYRVAGDCAGEWVAWGTHNKDLPIRQFSPNRWEFRFLDATANVYLFIAALLSAGMAGMKQKRILTIGDCQIVPSALSFEEAERQLRDFGITERMPIKLEMSLDCAKGDKELRDWIGAELFSQYIKVKEKEVEYFSKMTDDERRQKFLGYF
jgi:glutamine synthetase